MEGYEFFGVSQLLNSDILLLIDQIHLEIHDIKSEPAYFDMQNMIESLTALKDDYGFHVIHYEPNLSIERSASKGNQYYTYFDVVLYKNP